MGLSGFTCWWKRDLNGAKASGGHACMDHMHEERTFFVLFPVPQSYEHVLISRLPHSSLDYKSSDISATNSIYINA